MDIATILNELRSERERFSLAITAVEALNGTGNPAIQKTAPVSQPAPKPRGRHKMSAAGRRRIAEAAKAMWARRKKQSAPPMKTAPVRHMSAATKKRLSEIAKKRWAQRKKAAAKA